MKITQENPTHCSEKMSNLPRKNRVVLGLSYHGARYCGWQSQPDGRGVQDALEKALADFAGLSENAPRITTICAGRTDAGVHALAQVVHFDAPVVRTANAWVRGVNRYLPADIAIQWARVLEYECENGLENQPQNVVGVLDDKAATSPQIDFWTSRPQKAWEAENGGFSHAFHARASARARRYAYVILQSPVRPSVEAGRVGWVFQPLNMQAMREAAHYLLGEHDFSAFRAAGCQAKSPVKILHKIDINFVSHTNAPMENPQRKINKMPCGYWRFDFVGDAFLHHMIRNIIGCLVYVGQGSKSPQWLHEVLLSKNRSMAAPTFSPDGLYFLGPIYDAAWNMPQATAPFDMLPGPPFEFQNEY